MDARFLLGDQNFVFQIIEIDLGPAQVEFVRHEEAESTEQAARRITLQNALDGEGIVGVSRSLMDQAAIEPHRHY